MFTGRKTRLLEDAQGKPVRTFIQIDGFTHVQHDDCITPDEDGDCLILTTTPELRNTDCIRLQFTPDTPIADVTQALRKMITWLETFTQSDLEEKGRIEANRQRLIDVEMRTGKRQAILHPEESDDIPF